MNNSTTELSSLENLGDEEWSVKDALDLSNQKLRNKNVIIFNQSEQELGLFSLAG